MNLKVSKYNIIVPFTRSKNFEFLVYNGINDTIIKVDKELIDVLENNNLALLKEEEKRGLLNLGILTYHENEINSYIFRHRSKIYSPLECEFTLRLTSECNLYCNGCLSESSINKNIISSELVGRILDVIKSQSLTIGAKVINLRIIGGEPLLHPELTLKIMKDLKYWGKQEKIDVMGALVTNGTLLDENLIDEIASFFDVIQITLEGDPIEHNSIRKFKDGTGTFNSILKSIEMISNTEYPIFVLIRLHITENSFKSLNSLLSILKEKNIHLNPRINIFPIGRFSKNTICQMFAPFCVQDINPDLILASIKKLHEFGFKQLPRPLPTYMNLPCPLSSAYSLAFDLDGNCYNCLRMIGNQELRAAYFDKENFVRNPEHVYDFSVREAQDYNECKGCKLMVFCNGGCAYRAFEENGSYNSFNCANIQDIIPKKLLMYYEFSKDK